jgi:hypothetical protein
LLHAASNAVTMIPANDAERMNLLPQPYKMLDQLPGELGADARLPA